MMKKNILLLLMGMFVLISCEEEIYENVSTTMTVEQYAPKKENGVMKLSGKVSMPQEFSRETAKVGFYVREFTSDMNNRLEWLFEEYYVIDAYRALMNGEQGNYYDGQFLWVDAINGDGTFEKSFSSELKQYVCFAFAINAVSEDDYNCQVLGSKPFFFSGEGAVRLELENPLFHQFKLTFSSESDVEVGLCWSATNAQPNVEDCIGSSDFWGIYSNSVTFDVLDFGDNDVVYLRGYIQKRIVDNNSSDGTSYKIIYSNVIELRPKELVVNINTKEDLQNFINLICMYEDFYNMHDINIWNVFRGKINFNYEVQKEDWIDEQRTAEYGRTMYLEIPYLHCSIVGSKGGVIPYISNVSKSGMIKGMTVERCDYNHGTLENLQNSFVSTNNGEIKGASHLVVDSNQGTITESSYVEIDSNYGKLLNSKNVFVESNNGLVQGCKDAYGTKESEGGGYDTYWCNMVYTNKADGRIMNCIIENPSYAGILRVDCYVCNTNYGYIENSGPEAFCCTYNYGIIKSSQGGHGSGSNAGGGIVDEE